ncbi:hypothetical protein [[Eubacterium] cellulosolvens]
MVECRLCRRTEGLFHKDWKECPRCHSVYCPDCNKRLKTQGGVINRKVCAHCGKTI